MAVEMTRYRLSVPKADETVNKWIGKQNNLSHSLRTLIRMHIVEFGMTDPTCLNLEDQGFLKGNPKVSDKPSKKAVQADNKKEDNSTPDIKEPLKTPVKEVKEDIPQPIEEEEVKEPEPMQEEPDKDNTEEDDEDDVFADVDAMFGR